jgi:phage baseplate assembly protein W
MTTPIVFNGIKFPFQQGSTSFPEGATDDVLIKDSLFQLLMTSVGERVMRPDLGSNVTSLVFENNDVVLGSLIRAEVQGVIARFEPRVKVLDIQVEQQDSTVILTLSYVVLATRKPNTVSIGIPT